MCGIHQAILWARRARHPVSVRLVPFGPGGTAELWTTRPPEGSPPPPKLPPLECRLRACRKHALPGVSDGRAIDTNRKVVAQSAPLFSNGVPHMLPMLAMTALSGGLSMMSGIGARNSAKKQARLQKIENDRVMVANESEVGRTNEWNYNIGRELLANPTQRGSSSVNGVDVDRMMADADRAGFNPVTWLQAGAMQAYGFSDNTSWETNPVEAFRMMLKTPNLQSASTIGSVPDAMSIVGDAGQAALSTFRSEYAREDSQAFQSQQLTRRLEAIQAGRASAGLGSIPRRTTSDASRAWNDQPWSTGSSGALDWASSSGLGLWKPEVGKVTYTNPYQSGPISQTPDGGVWAQRYGEPGDWLGGVATFGRDMFKRQFGQEEWEWWGKTGLNPMNPMPDYLGMLGNPNRSQPWLGSAL